MDGEIEEQGWQVELRLLEFMESKYSPVWAAYQLTALIYHEGTNAKEYRRVLRALNRLKKKGLVDGENWTGANNVTVWWLVSRFKEPTWAQNIHDIPFL